MREAFTESGIFAGWPEHIVPIHNVEAVLLSTDITLLAK